MESTSQIMKDLEWWEIELKDRERKVEEARRKCDDLRRELQRAEQDDLRSTGMHYNH